MKKLTIVLIAVILLAIFIVPVSAVEVNEKNDLEYWLEKSEEYVIEKGFHSRRTHDIEKIRCFGRHITDEAFFTRICEFSS